MILLAALAGALVGAGVWLVVRGVAGANFPIAAFVAELHRPRIARPVASSRFDAALERIAGPVDERRTAALAVCERDTSKFVQDRLVWTLLGASPGLAFMALAAADAVHIFSMLFLLLATGVGAVVGWFWSLVDLRKDAETARREFRHALASYLDLVTILIAGGAGVETALYDAAAIGRGRAFRHIRTALSAAQARREAPWASLGALGRRLGVRELQELDASMHLAGDGARVRDSLVAKAESMRVKDLAQLESDAEVRSETMVLPVAMMFAGFLLLIGYPALAALSTP